MMSPIRRLAAAVAAGALVCVALTGCAKAATTAGTTSPASEAATPPAQAVWPPFSGDYGVPGLYSLPDRTVLALGVLSYRTSETSAPARWIVADTKDAVGSADASPVAIVVSRILTAPGKLAAARFDGTYMIFSGKLDATTVSPGEPPRLLVSSLKPVWTVAPKADTAAPAAWRGVERPGLKQVPGASRAVGVLHVTARTINGVRDIIARVVFVMPFRAEVISDPVIRVDLPTPAMEGAAMKANGRYVAVQGDVTPPTVEGLDSFIAATSISVLATPK
jgi:hypothetical protein